MRKLLVLLVLLILVAGNLPSTVQAQETFCIQLGQQMRVRAQPSIESAIVTRMNAQTIVLVTNDPSGWYRIADGSGFIASGYRENVVSCDAPIATSPQVPPANNSAQGSFSGWTNHEGSNLYFHDLPSSMNAADVNTLIQILAGRVERLEYYCPDSLFLVAFATRTEMQAFRGDGESGYDGFRTYAHWDGATLTRRTNEDSCSQLVHAIFILKGTSLVRSWVIIAHEIAHVFGAKHGASSHSGVDDANPNITGLGDAYWIEGEVRIAYRTPRRCESELCLVVADLVFHH